MDLQAIVDFVKRHRDPILAVLWICALGWLFSSFLSVLAPFLVALVLAYLLEPVVAFVQSIGWKRFRVRRMTAVLTIYVVLFAVLLSVGLPMLVNLADELVGIASRVEGADLQREAQEIVQRYSRRVNALPLPPELRSRLGDLASDPKELSTVLAVVFKKLRQILSSLLRGGAGFLGTLLGAGMQLALVPVLLFYFMLEYPKLSGRVMHVVPSVYRPWMKSFIARVDVSLGGFVRGQLLIAFLFGLIMTLGLWIIGIPYAVVLGPVSGFANLVPYLGVVVGLVPAFFIALWVGGFTMEGLGLCGAIVLLFLVIQTLDGYVFQPKILGPSVGLHPLWIMVALSLGQQTMGVVGMILAVPTAAVLRVLLEDAHSLLYPA